MNKMKRNFFKTAFFSLLALGALCSCSKDGDEDADGNGTIQNNTLNVTVENAASYSGKISDVKMTVEDSEIVLASAPYNSGKFTLTLPESPGRQYLGSVAEDEEGLTVSDPDVKAVFVILSAYESGFCVGSFFHGTGDWVGMLTYADGDVSISGTYSHANYIGGTTAERFHNCKLTGGWNIVYIKVTEKGSSDEYIYTTQVPEGAKWYFTAIEVEEDE
jgi:hypothetical protein